MQKSLISKFFILLLVVGLLFAVAPKQAQAQTTSIWNGTYPTARPAGMSAPVSGVQEVHTAEEFAWLASQPNMFTSGVTTVKLMVDIDLDSKPWTPSSALGGGLANTFDGNGHTISNLTVNVVNTTDAIVHAAMFLQSSYDMPLIKQLIVDGANVSVTAGNLKQGYAGVVASGVDWHGSFQNVTVKNASVTGTKYVGGIASYNSLDWINCTVTNVTLNVIEHFKPDGTSRDLPHVGALVGLDNAGQVYGNTVSYLTIIVTPPSGQPDRTDRIGALIGTAQPEVLVGANNVSGVTLNGAPYTKLIGLDQRTYKVVNTTQMLGYTTIQAAVTAATDGDVIVVGRGTYTENVSINKAVTLLGAQAGVDARTRAVADAEETILNPTGTAFSITGTTGAVIVDGFKFTPTYVGVYLGSGTGHLIQNNIFSNIPTSGYGVNSAASGLMLKHNRVDNTYIGFEFNSLPANNVTVTENLFTGASNYNINFIEGGTGIVISNNEKTAGSGNLVVLFKTTGALVTGNTSTGATSTAIYLGGANSGTQITGNTISGGTGTAITVSRWSTTAISENSNVTITGNTLVNNAKGVNVGDSALSGTVTMHTNKLVGNTMQVTNSATSGGQTIADKNWWGQATGPTLSLITGDVSYIPWCTNEACTTFGGPVHNVTHDTFFATIQGAIDVAVDGDVIEVGPGTYTESLNINKGVTLRAVDQIGTVVLSDTQAPGVWYPDRYRPAVFEAAVWQGRNAIKHGVRVADSLENRPTSYQGTFYNTQGRKLDTTLTGPVQRMSIDMWVDAAWATQQAYSGLWSTGFNGSNAVSAYPIIAWRSPTGTAPGFYYWDDAGWHLAKLADSSDYDKWHTLAFELRVGQGVQYYLDGQPVGAFLADTVTQSLGNVILNVYNYGADYDVYWDNFSTSGVSIVGQATVNASGVTFDGFNLSNPGANFGMLVNPGSSNVTITGNIFENIGGVAMTDNVKGVYLLSGPDNVTIEGNIFRNIQSGTKSANAIYSGDSNATDAAEGLVIRNNIFENIISASWGSYGVLLNNGTGNPGVIIEGNTFDGISGAWSRGVGLEGPTPNATVKANVFSDITAPTAGYNAGVFFEDNAGLATTSITNNQFLLTGFGVAVHPDMGTHATVLASPNWWGQLTGPAAGQLPSSGDYDSSPWCANAACTEFLPAMATIAPVDPVVCGNTTTTTIDVNISGIPASMVAQGYQLTLHFDPTKTSIASEDDIAQGGFLPLTTGFQVLDIDNTNGTFVIASTIYGAATNDPGKPLAKITLTHLGFPGDIDLSLSDVLLSDVDGQPIPADVSTEPVTLTLQPAVLNTTREPDAGYCSLAQAIEDAVDGDNLKLVADIAIPEMVTVDKELTLDLNGKTATVPVGVTALKVTSATGNLTIDDSATGGLITGGYYSVYVDGGADFTLDGGSLLGSDWGIHARGAGSSLTVNDGVIDAQYFAISGNGLPESAGTIIDINGGTISSDYTAIYLPQAGTVDISGGTITGHTGIEIKSGTLNISGGTITATGTYVVDPGEGDGGTVESGDAIFVISNPDYAGEMVISISGGTFTSATGYALREYVDEAFTDTAVDTLTVTGGTFIGGVETGEAGAAVTFSTQLTALQAPELALQGGLYNTDPASPDVFVFVPYGTVLNGTMYEIVSISLNVHDFYYNNSGTLRGVSTDFYATNFLFSEASSVVVELFSGEEGSYVLQQTNTLKVPTNHPGSVLTSSFDFFGTYISNSWENDRETEFGQTVAPTRVLVTVVLPGGTLTAENTILTGDRTTILPGVSGLVTLQGILAPKADVKIFLTSGTVVRDTLSTALSDINYGFTGVETLTYTFTTNQARYLNLTTDSGKTFLVDRDLNLTDLRLYGGDVDQSNKIDVNDASLVGAAWGSTEDPEANINYDGIVNIQDLALVGGNYMLNSATAYNWWSPLP